MASTAAFVGKLKGSACPDANSFLVDIAMDGTASCGGLDASQGSCDTGEVVQGLDSALKATCVEDKVWEGGGAGESAKHLRVVRP